jgi:fucose permease
VCIIYGVGDWYQTEPLYLRMMLDFQRDDRSHVMVVVGMSTFSVMVVLMPWLLPRLKERKVIMLALFCNFLHVVLYALIWEKSQVFLIALIGAVGYMSYPASSSLLSKNVSTKEQGAAQGALSGFKSLTQ